MSVLHSIRTALCVGTRHVEPAVEGASPLYGILKGWTQSARSRCSTPIEMRTTPQYAAIGACLPWGIDAWRSSGPEQCFGTRAMLALIEIGSSAGTPLLLRSNSGWFPALVARRETAPGRHRAQHEAVGAEGRVQDLSKHGDTLKYTTKYIRHTELHW